MQGEEAHLSFWAPGLTTAAQFWESAQASHGVGSRSVAQHHWAAC